VADEDGKQENGDPGEAPEVEAELVVDPPAAGDAFDDDEKVDAASDAPPPGEVAPARTPLLTPGVILFIAFAVVALIAFAVWRMQPRDGKLEEPAAETGVAAASDAANNPPVEAASAPAHETKIENQPAETMKRPPAPTDQADAGYLPPVTEEGAAKISNSVEEGAKEAMRRFEEAENEKANAAAEETPPAGDVTGFEISGADETSSAQSPAEADAPSMSATDDTSAPATADKIANAPDNGDLKEEMKALRETFESERARLASALEAAQQNNRDQADQLASLRSELEAATARETELQNDIDAMRTDYQKVRNDDLNNSARQMKASFALAALTRAVAQGGPFEEELAAVAEFEPSARSVLEAHAKTGVATEAALRSRFDAAARAALSAAAMEKAGGGLSGLWARVKSVISVRPARPTTGDGPGPVLSRAENALNEGEVAFALLQLEDLPVSAQEAMADWIADARARAETDAALNTLQARLSGETG